MRVLERLSRSGRLMALALLVSGCVRHAGQGLTIATNWPEDRRRNLEAEFLRRDEGGGGSITWIVLAPGVEPGQVVGRIEGLDVLLGGPASTYRSLEEAGRWEAASGGGAAWTVAARSAVGLAVDLDATGARAVPGLPGWPDLTGPALRELVALDDPRTAPVTLALAEARLVEVPWAEGYADLIRLAGRAQRFGRREGAAMARLERGEAAVVPAVLDRVGPRAVPASVAGSPEAIEGAAVLRDARHPERARAFLRFLASRGGSVDAASSSDREEPPAASILLAELLGATLVDPQDELRDAWRALDTVDATARAASEAWLTEAPPWPPASVQVLARGDDPETWLNALALAIVPDAEARAWLLTSWRDGPRPIDGALLADLGRAAGGRLVAEPRLVAWLRAEWTTWARQRYGRVASMTGGPPPS